MNDYAGYTDAALRALAAAAPESINTYEHPNYRNGLLRAEGFYHIARLALPAALDRVAALEAENARLREALEQYADRSNWVFRDSPLGPSSAHRDLWFYHEHGYERAWKALQPETRAALGEASHE